MDNPETLATLGTQDKDKQNKKTQYKNEKDELQDPTDSQG